MNLTKLFETQDILDERIKKEKGLEGRDLLPEKILALQVELGELANEWRGFKFWSENQQPRTKQYCLNCGGRGDHEGYIKAPMIELAMVECRDCEGSGIERNPLLEEYVDGLHFILSIGLESADFYGDDIPINVIAYRAGEQIYKEENITLQLNSLFLDVASLYDAAVGREYDFQDVDDAYKNIVGGFVGLGEMLGFTWKQIEQAYYKKNEINHARQSSNY